MHLHYLSFQEVDTNGLLIVLGEDALAVSLDHTRFAYSAVAHDHHLDGHLHILFQHGCKLGWKTRASRTLGL